MRKLLPLFNCLLTVISSSLLVSCATTELSSSVGQPVSYNTERFNVDYSTRLPSRFETKGRKTVVIDPNVHAWGAYGHDGNLIRAGIATAGGTVCPPDEEGSCRTGIGKFRITSLGDGECYSKTYPRPYGGGLMPYCMYFNGGQALHGSPDPIVVEDNVSHGCVRMRISDAEWMRFNFAEIGTPVVVMPYS